MSPFKIRFGASWRVLAMIIFTAMSLLTIFTAPSVISKTFSALVCLAFTPFLVAIISRMAKAKPKPRLGLAMIGINLTFTLYAIVTLALVPHLPAWVHAVLTALASWHAFITWVRYRQYQSGSYLMKFEPKPKRPSPLAPIRQYIAAQGAAK